MIGVVGAAAFVPKFQRKTDVHAVVGFETVGVPIDRVVVRQAKRQPRADREIEVHPHVLVAAQIVLKKHAHVEKPVGRARDIFHVAAFEVADLADAVLDGIKFFAGAE